MISNSRPVTQKIAFGSEIPSSSRVADAYSDDLMDDLFLDVDQILDGDLSSYMTVVGHQPKPTNPSTRTVTLPDNFVPRSAADIYRVTMAAANSSPVPSTQRHPNGNAGAQNRRPIESPPFNPPVYSKSTSSQSARSTGYSGGGRPVTAPRRTARSAAQSGNLQSTVVHTSQSAASSSDLYGQTIDLHRVDAQPNPIQSVSNYLYPNEPLPELTLANISPRSPQTVFQPQRQKQPAVSLPFMLMGAAGISAASTMGLWMASQSNPSNGWLLSLSREASAAELPQNSDEEFLAYLQQSLDVISTRQDEVNQTVAVIPAVQTTPALPTTVPNTNAAPQLGALPNLPGAAATPNIIERVFVPVYQNAPTAAVATAPVPNAALPANAPRPTVPVPAPVAAAAAVPPGAPLAAAASLPIVPTATQAPAALPVPSVIAAAPTNPAAVITNTAPASDHVLVGILNLGSRSAALFDLDGSSQRAYVGDRIGVSDWTLVSVNGQDVVVRRDGEVRAIYIGQRF
ncbi:MAG: hypothetical protein AAFP03_11285 [Cyanobacteria bacterium J06598_3]